MRSCGGANTGVCMHGTKQRSYLLDKFRLGEGGSLARLNEFRGWMMSTMMQALYLQAVCLPIETNTCPSEIDPVSDANMKMSVNAINETIKIFKEAEECICPCKQLYLKTVTVGITDGGGEVEGWTYIGVQRNGQKEKKYASLAITLKEQVERILLSARSIHIASPKLIPYGSK